MEERFPFFQDKSWACSFSQIQWNQENIGSAKLEFIAYKFGFHFDGHRAINDCEALYEILQNKLQVSNDLVLKQLIENAELKETRIYALNSKFDTKDILKARGYRWNIEKRQWYLSGVEINIANEVDWLKLNIYNNKQFQIEIEEIDSLSRFSTRSGNLEMQNH